jgi:putative transposase
MTTIQKAFRYRIMPTLDQQRLLALQFGHARFVYNHYRMQREQTYQATAKGLSYADCANDLPRLKATYPWLRDADSQVLQQALKNLDQAYQNFFAGRAQYPKFKRKHDHKREDIGHRRGGLLRQLCYKRVVGCRARRCGLR